MAVSQGAVGPSPRLRTGAKLAYGLGDFGFGLSWNLVGAFLLIFYTDVAVLPAAAVGTLLLVARLADAVFDPLVGVAVDRTQSRLGRARPWFAWGAAPFGLLCVASFWSPPLGEGARLAWAIVTFGLLGLVFSAVNIPYGALMPMMTDRPDERLALGSLRSAGTAVSVIVATAATMPLVGLFGGGDQGKGFLILAVLAGIVTAATTLNLLRCPEQVHAPDEHRRGTLAAEVRQMLGNRVWRTVFAFAMLNFIRFGAVLAVTPFFAINVLGRPWMISVLLPAVSGTLLIGAALAPPILRRLGMRRGNLLALVVAEALFAMLPFAEGQSGAFIAIYVAASVVLSITMTAIFAMQAEAIDHHEALYGVRNEGLLSSAISLSIKIGMAIGGAIIAYGLAAAGYAPGAVGAGTITAMRWLYYAPILGCIALQIAVIARYPAKTPTA